MFYIDNSVSHFFARRFDQRHGQNDMVRWRTKLPPYVYLSEVRPLAHPLAFAVVVTHRGCRNESQAVFAACKERTKGNDRTAWGGKFAESLR